MEKEKSNDKELIEFASAVSLNAAFGGQQGEQHSPNIHNLDITYLGVCRKCGGTKLKDAPYEDTEQPSSEEQTEWKEAAETILKIANRECDKNPEAVAWNSVQGWAASLVSKFHSQQETIKRLEELNQVTTNAFDGLKRTSEQRITELTRELEQEREKKLDALEALCSMWNQYCPHPHGHMFMSAGEEAEEVLDKYKLLKNDKGAGGEVDWEKLEQLKKELYSPSKPSEEGNKEGEEGAWRF